MNGGRKRISRVRALSRDYYLDLESQDDISNTSNTNRTRDDCTWANLPKYTRNAYDTTATRTDSSWEESDEGKEVAEREKKR